MKTFKRIVSYIALVYVIIFYGSLFGCIVIALDPEAITSPKEFFYRARIFANTFGIATLIMLVVRWGYVAVVMIGGYEFNDDE